MNILNNLSGRRRLPLEERRDKKITVTLTNAQYEQFLAAGEMMKEPKPTKFLHKLVLTFLEENKDLIQQYQKLTMSLKLKGRDML